MKEKLNRYERILARPDKKRPDFVKELLKSEFLPKNGMVLSIKVLTEDGGTVDIKWSEKIANEFTAKER